MLSLIASWILTLLAVAVAAYVVGRCRRNAERLAGEVDRKLDELEALVAAARHQSQQLLAAVAAAKSLGPDAPRDLLQQIEQLADPTALDDPQAIAQVAAEVRLPAGVADDLFAADEKTLAIARLADQGHSPAEIASALSLPIGEVELLLSLRPA